MSDSSLTFSRHAGRSTAIARLPRLEPATFDACSICLRVRHDGRWVEAETAIRAFRSYEHAATPRLRPAICDDCARAIALRRGRAGIAKAA